MQRWGIKKANREKLCDAASDDFCVGRITKINGMRRTIVLLFDCLYSCCDDDEIPETRCMCLWLVWCFVLVFFCCFGASLKKLFGAFFQFLCGSAHNQLSRKFFKFFLQEAETAATVNSKQHDDAMMP